MRFRSPSCISACFVIGAFAGSLAHAAEPACLQPASVLSFDDEKAPGSSGRGLRLNGKDQFREIAPGWRTGTGEFTIEAWVRFTDSVHIRNIIDNRDADARGFLLYVRRGEAGFQVSDGGQPVDVMAVGLNIADGKWHHVAGVVKRLPPQPSQIYVDGQLRASSPHFAPRGNLDHAQPLWIGRHHENRFVPRDDVYYQGSVDEVALYRKALTAAEILRLAKHGPAARCPVANAAPAAAQRSAQK